ncbi:PA0069 family radical SAM protein [Ideonella livida]|uniref:PA0069 family radical SAM protein n=1 Tax=Ideonella livida TaxID=2707176 RepID=A0A7C9PFE9_9BURK|nr:PA0069 family radical SAM protein [Ideonella livida]NDY90553.1 PA0069 family radical SAM protein [Ideonella livida]
MPFRDSSTPIPVSPSVKGRGTVWLMPHRFSQDQREPVDDGWCPQRPRDARSELSAVSLPTRVEPVEVRSILTGNDSPDIKFDLSLNPYRGCEHGCIYCYARPTHSYLNLSPGLEFETRILAKTNAAQRLREALASPGYEPLALNLGSATDAYQPAERRLGITRALIEVLAEHRHPFSVITKSASIERDLDLLAPMAAQGLVGAYVSITTLDPALAAIMEPRAAAPQRRLQTIERLANAGIPVGVSVSPVIPFLNEPELERILESAAAAGARHAFSIPLRLPWEVNPLFQDWLARHFPQRAARVMARLRDMRGGKDNDAQFGSRMTGHGLWADLLRQRFEKARRRLGLSADRIVLDDSLFRRPEPAAGQKPESGPLPLSRRRSASGAGVPSQTARMPHPTRMPLQRPLF